MASPTDQPLPRFLADAPDEGLPYGRLAETLVGAFLEAFSAIEDLPADAGRPASARFFPERRWGGRVWVPLAAREDREGGEGPAIEYVGHVSFIRPEGGEPRGFHATCDWTDETVDQHPEWKLDINDDVIGLWRGGQEREGDVTLVWGEPQVPGAEMAIAELGGELADQVELAKNRFTLVAVDGLSAEEGALELTVRLFNRRGEELAAESLYEDEAEAEGEAQKEGEDAEEQGPDEEDGEGPGRD